MAVVGIICEYNPFHLGHARQFQLVRERFGPDTKIICLMSGNYVQRGAPAVFDKFVRSRAAVLCGASLVLELPLTCALSSAEGFAQGGVGVMDRLGVVDKLCFGSEHGAVRALQETARLLLAPGFDDALRTTLQGGMSFAAARAETVRRLGGDDTLLRQPNDILAVEYLKAIERLQSRLEPVSVLRQGSYHVQTPDPEQPSATALRILLEQDGAWEQYVPSAAARVFRGAAQYGFSYGERAVLARLRTLEESDFQHLPYGAEGLWRKLQKACRTQPSVEAILRAVKSKRYAYSRLQRMLLCAFLGLTEAELHKQPSYVRALAFDAAGRGLLRRIRSEGCIPVINAGEVPEDNAYYALERRAGDLFTLFAKEPSDTVCGLEAAGRIFYVKETEKTLAK